MFQETVATFLKLLGNHLFNKGIPIFLWVKIFVFPFLIIQWTILKVCDIHEYANIHFCHGQACRNAWKARWICEAIYHGCRILYRSTFQNVHLRLVETGCMLTTRLEWNRDTMINQEREWISKKECLEWFRTLVLAPMILHVKLEAGEVKSGMRCRMKDYILTIFWRFSIYCPKIMEVKKNFLNGSPNTVTWIDLFCTQMNANSLDTTSQTSIMITSRLKKIHMLQLWEVFKSDSKQMFGVD